MLRLISRGPVQRTLVRFTIPRISHSRQKLVIRSDWKQSLTTTSYYLGQSVILFVWFYSGLQWLHYRKERKKMEDDESNQ